jgi:undecaprenyl-diphosphatase
MFWLSNKFFWIPLYLVFLYLIIKQYKKQSVLIILFLIALIVLSDQLSVHAFKNLFMRLRPCHEPNLAGLVHLVNGKCGGQFGFISSHACNHFALAVFLASLLGRRIRYFSLGILIWAGIIAYSRVYLGVHYPGDIIVGAIVGSGIGISFSYILNKYILKPSA